MLDYRITIAAENDSTEEVLNLVRDFVGSTVYSVTDLDDDYLRNFIESFKLSDQTKSTLLLLSVENLIVGFLAGVVNDTHPLFSKVKVAGELAWWVTPEHRGHGKLLLEAYILWAKTMGCKYVTTSDLPSMDLSGLYKKYGFEPAERSYLKVID